MPELGYSRFNRAPDISAAERESVSTAPGSQLQEAIEGSRYLDKGFFTTDELLTGGPKAFDIWEKAATKRQDRRSKSAFNAINMTNAALSSRGVQSRIDGQAEMEQEFDEYQATVKSKGQEAADILFAGLSNPLTQNLKRNQAESQALRAQGLGSDLASELRGTELSVAKEPAQREARARTLRGKAKVAALEVEKTGTELLKSLAAGKAGDRLGVQTGLSVLNMDSETKGQLAKMLVSEGEEDAQMQFGVLAELMRDGGAILGETEDVQLLREVSAKAMKEFIQTKQLSDAAWDAMSVVNRRLQDHKEKILIRDQATKRRSAEASADKAEIMAEREGNPALSMLKYLEMADRAIMRITKSAEESYYFDPDEGQSLKTFLEQKDADMAKRLQDWYDLQSDINDKRKEDKATVPEGLAAKGKKLLDEETEAAPETPARANTQPKPKGPLGNPPSKVGKDGKTYYAINGQWQEWTGQTSP